MNSQSRLLVFEQLESEKNIRYAADYLRKLVKAGKFPQPFRLSPRKLVWREEAIDQWIAKRERGED